MAYDPCPSAAAQRIADETGHRFGARHDIIGISEYELKLNFTSPLAFVDSATAIQYGERSFSDLMKSFRTAASGTQKSFFDPAGLIPNDYVLVSLGMDTVKTLPMAEFFLNDMQYRLRFPIHPHDKNITSGSEIISLNSIDANLKDRLSKMKAGEHRIELETTITNPLQSLQEFKKLNNVPSFMKNITDEDLRVSEVCMTSRVGFFMMTKVPNADAHILLHGCFDVSRYTTPAMEVFTNRTPRIEIELEAKYFFGNDANLSDESTQKEYVNRVFSQMTKISNNYNFSVFERSKMEDAAHSVEEFYARHAPEIGKANNSPVASYLREMNISPYLAYSLSQGKRISHVFNDINNSGHQNSLIQLASSLPDPRELLKNDNPFSDRAVA